MALGDFDPNQSSIEFGQSLLADAERRRKKRKRSSKKIKNVSYLLGAIQLGDLFLAKKARRKAGIFEENLTAEKAGELNKQRQANNFYEDQLKTLLSKSPGIDFEREGVWDKNGSLWDAIEKQMAAEAKGAANIGIATTVAGSKQFTDPEYAKYLEEINRRTQNSMNTLKAQYMKHKGYLGVTDKTIEAKYKKIIDSGIRDLLSAKNTSTIRKILAKFDVLNDIKPDLELIEDGSIGGIDKIYLNKDIIKSYKNNILANTQNIKNYNKAIEELDIDLDKVQLTPQEKAAVGTQELRSTKTEHPLGYEGLRIRLGQVNSKGIYMGSSSAEAWASSDGEGTLPKNTEISRLNSILVDGETPLGNFPDLVTGDPNNIKTFSQFWDEIYRQEEDEGDGRRNHNDFVAAVDSELYTVLSEKEITMVEGLGLDPKTTAKPPPTDEDYARAIYQTLADEEVVGWDAETEKYIIKRASLEKETPKPGDALNMITGASGTQVSYDELVHPEQGIVSIVLKKNIPPSEKQALFNSAKIEYAEYPELIEIFEEQLNNADPLWGNKEMLAELEAEKQRRAKVRTKVLKKMESPDYLEDAEKLTPSLLEKKYPWLLD